MKRMFKIMPFLMSLFVVSCFASSPYKKIPSTSFGKQIKKVILIEMEPSGNILPDVPKEFEALEFTPEYRKDFAELMKKNVVIYNNTVESIFKEGKYKLQVIRIPFSEVIVTKESLGDFVLGSYTWKNNYTYKISKEEIMQLIQKHGADAVYFQQLNIVFDKVYYFFGGGSVHLASFSIRYDGVMYDRAGDVIFHKSDADYRNTNSYARSARFIDTLEEAKQVKGRLYTPERKPVQELAKSDMLTQEGIEIALGKTDAWAFAKKYGYLFEFWR